MLLRSLWSAGRKSYSASPTSTFRPFLSARAPFLLPRAFSSASAAPTATAPIHSALDPSRLRNVAVIAHVDHGKTTLMDRLLRQCGADIPHERAMDSNSLERERGITIASKVRVWLPIKRRNWIEIFFIFVKFVFWGFLFSFNTMDPSWYYRIGFFLLLLQLVIMGNRLLSSD